ncbi:hypothetical protein C789_2597 [Microcystis aeruginosa FACHB-905 = DIANCHI905]|uniref:DUF3265 domain-containing protein n=1 Tax=Microcystis aeruginosa PCC 7806SL TaxID=1903187 RepID=A0AB33BXM0_MICA7|nr:hypothetical protein BH695_1157 [Microcystis aeruginosa PCC 7806SL]ELS47583.1 hypothetical protein C789_2597 [Microcystis aeruginosa FACHB-905 = DIANCHI905]
MQLCRMAGLIIKITRQFFWQLFWYNLGVELRVVLWLIQ